MPGEYVSGDDNIAIGTRAGSGTAASPLEVNDTVAIGHLATATQDGGTAIGAGSLADGEQATAVGGQRVLVDENGDPILDGDGNEQYVSTSALGKDSTALG